MKKETMTELEKFLREEKVFTKFKVNYKKLNSPLRDPIKTFLRKEGGFYRVIKRGFVWNNTPEGGDFWKNLNDKFVEYLKK